MKYPPHKPRHYNVAEAKAQFSTLVRRALQGEEIIVAKDNKPLVKIVPIGVVDRKPGSAKGQVRMAPDFDAPLDDFEDYR
jgi:prevent-host-death family protein